MKAMILAAGRGQRMLPLTAQCPKPLLTVAEKPLLVYQIENLVRAGLTEIVINVSCFPEQFREAIGEGSQFGAEIQFSFEAQPLETGGGIKQALPLLGEGFAVIVSGDLWTDFPFASLPQTMTETGAAHIVLVDNPPHHPAGDFHLQDNGRVCLAGEPKLNYAGIGIYDLSYFSQVPERHFGLSRVLQTLIAQGQVTGQYYAGHWENIGTITQLQTALLNK